MLNKRISSSYTLLKVVSYYDPSVLSMSVMGFQKKSVGGWVGAVSSFILDFWKFVNFAKPLRTAVRLTGWEYPAPGPIPHYHQGFHHSLN